MKIHELMRHEKKELDEAQRKLNWFKKKYQDQLKSQKLTFSAPIPKEEKK